MKVSIAAVRWRRRNGKVPAVTAILDAVPAVAAILDAIVRDIANRLSSTSGSSFFRRHFFNRLPITLKN